MVSGTSLGSIGTKQGAAENSRTVAATPIIRPPRPVTLLVRHEVWPHSPVE
jgi:hypothetical protein